MQHKDELQQIAAYAEVQRQQRIADNDDNAEHFADAFRFDKATKLVAKWDEGDVLLNVLLRLMVGRWINTLQFSNNIFI